MKIVTSNVYKNKNGIYIAHKGLNGLFFSSNKELSKVEEVGMFPDLSSDEAWNLNNIIEHREKVYFFSTYFYEAWKLENNNQLKKIEYGSERKRVIIKAVIKHGDYVWVFPAYFSQKIIKVDLNTWETESFSWYDKRYLDMDKESFSEFGKVDNTIFFTNRVPDHVGYFRMNLDTLELNFTDLNQYNSVSSILPEEKYIWVLGRKHDGMTMLTKYDYCGSTIKEYSLEKDLIKTNETKITYHHIIKIKDNILIPPYLGNTLIVVKDNDVIKKIVDEDITGIFDYFIDDENVFLFSEKKPYAIDFDVNKNVYLKKELYSLKSEKIKILNNEKVYESACINLKDLIMEITTIG